MQFCDYEQQFNSVVLFVYIKFSRHASLLYKICVKERVAKRIDKHIK